METVVWLLSLAVVGMGCTADRTKSLSHKPPLPLRERDGVRVIGIDSKESATVSGPEQMMSIAQVTPEEAKRLLDGGGFVYLDVRTVPEFVNGHAPSALNIPVVEMNPQIGAMELNGKFLSVVTANIPPDAQLIVGCKTGGRSTTACKVLAQASYKNVRNLDGGYAGVTDPTGHVVKEGWSTLGYPIERGDGDAKSYASLTATTKH